ncbi:MAG TPA: glycosyl hydrolase family 8 [Myxococcota bacterium]|nr:glycosyl hydrolase family 8 [Myxococcota bacterium]
MIWSSLRPGLLVLAVSCAATHAPPRRAQLRADWESYVHGYVQGDGRVIDQTMGAQSTSEGQAYAMLRAVWAGDREGFERLRTWTRDNLQGADADALPAWRWGARPDGTWGVLDTQPAADADLLISWSLLLAAERWDMPAWRAQALALARRVWDEETAELPVGRVLLPGPWARDMEPMWLNPSYFMPFVFRALAVHDPDHDWAALTDSSYRLLERWLDAHPVPPDWLFLDPRTGEDVNPPEGEEQRTDFGFEAVRVPWILAAELRWFDEPRARRLLTRMDLLAERFTRDGRVPAILTATGEPRVTWESRALYGSLPPGWADLHPDLVPKLLDRLDELPEDPALPQDVEPARRSPLAPRARPIAPQQGRDYYAKNWIWFGEALWSGVARPLEHP